MVTILVPLLIAISLAFSSTSGVVSALNSVDSFGAGVVRDIQSWVSGTSASADVKLPSRYNRLASLFSAVAALAVLPFSIGLLAKDLGYAGSIGLVRPLTPTLAFALGIVTLALLVVFSLERVPIYIWILGAITA
jgi:hypothetical protein